MPELRFTIIYIVCLFMAGIIGYAISKGSTCCVAAVMEMVQKRRVRRFLSFLLCSATVAIILMPIVWFDKDHTDLLPAYRLGWASLLGGAFYGIGALINGACNFGTIDRLSAGDTRYLFLFPGLIGGACLGSLLNIDTPPRTSSLIAEPGPIAYIWMALCVILLVSFTIASIRHKRERGTPGKPVAFYMTTIGALTALITIALGPWHYTRIAVVATNDWLATSAGHVAILAGLMGAVIIGALITAIREKRFKLRAPTLSGALYSTLGGALMGASLLLIPGGNDGIILSGLPSLSLSAVFAYTTMCLTIAFMILISERLMKITHKKTP